MLAACEGSRGEEGMHPWMKRCDHKSLVVSHRAWPVGSWGVQLNITPLVHTLYKGTVKPCNPQDQSRLDTTG